MADGDPWSMNRTAGIYAADDTYEARFRVVSKYFTQVSLGWVAPTLVTQKPPYKGLKPRVALTWDAGNHALRRRVVVATNAAYIALVPLTTTLVVQNPSTDVEDTFTVYSLEGERQRGTELD